eukprot:TRINITY_DN1026_c0_g1_i6.p1 TRINITY_DN1026_c0_g1~~TRINITY_DN1026_c0_g1_i6.p1  ORF type:complete len:451 (+),score=22.14 TRINITY_DN1026_c0_g1_i6:25-1353(+)
MKGVLCILITLFVLGAQGQYPRTVTIKNQCANDFYFEAVAGSYEGGDCPGHNTGLCAAGTYCADNDVCYFNQPQTTDGSYRVIAGGNNVLTIPYIAGDIPHWSGNIRFCDPATGCDKTNELCNSQGCGVWHGPFNSAEFTFQKNNLDFYDISNIGGVNVPMEFKPDTPNQNQANNVYYCGNTGAPSNPLTSVGISSWSGSPPNAAYKWISGFNTTAASNCGSDDECPTGQVCGMVYHQTPGFDPTFWKTCGKFEGFWTANTVCTLGQPSFFPSFYDFDCTKSVVNGPYTTTAYLLDSCKKGISESGSCYHDGADTACCGCADWNEVIGSSLVPTSTEQCKNKSPVWVEVVQPKLTWLKRVCPNCYTYPFDDMSSTFVCTTSSNGREGANHMNYTITLCPGGKDSIGNGDGDGADGDSSGDSGSASCLGSAFAGIVAVIMMAA